MHPDDPESIARPLAQWQTLICISPDYLREHPITQPQDLLNADWLNHNSNVLRHVFRCLGLLETLPENRTDCPDSSLAAREYACASMELAVLLSGDVSPLIENGQLNIVLPEHKLPTRTLYTTTAHRTQSQKYASCVVLVKGKDK